MPKDSNRQESGYSSRYKSCGSASLLCGSSFSLKCGSRFDFSLYYGSGSCESATASLQTLQGNILSHHVSIVGVHGPPRLHFKPLLLSFYFNADPHPALHSNADTDPDPASQNNADPCGFRSATLPDTLSKCKRTMNCSDVFSYVKYCRNKFILIFIFSWSKNWKKR